MIGFTTPAITYGHAATSIASAFAYGAESNTRIGNIPPGIVPSTIIAPEVQNNRQGAAIPNYGNTGAVATFVAPPNYLALSGPGSLSNYSVAFFAQLLSQSSPGDQTRLMQTFPNPVPFDVSRPETMESFAAIKFLPSNAAKTSAPKPDFITADIQAVAPQRVYTRNYQIAQRLQTDGEQIKLDMSRLGGIVQARNAAISGAPAVTGAAAAIQGISRSESDKTKSPAPNNLVYRAPNVSYGKSVRGANAYLNTLSLFNPPPISPVLRVL